MHFGSNNFECEWLFVLAGILFVKKRKRNFEKNSSQKFEQEIFFIKMFFWSYFTFSQIWCYLFFSGYGWGGGGGGDLWSKNQSCLEWPETHFGLGILKICWNFWNFVSTTSKAASPTMHFGSNNFEFGWLFVLVVTLFIKKRKKN